MPRPFIACCLIVKNAERTFAALLQDLRPGFDELVIVDTGSTDKTREIVVGALLDFDELATKNNDPEKVAAWWQNAQDKEHAVFITATGQRVVLAKFDWIKDFSAARNFAFGLATAEWRGYYDADDRVPNAPYLRKTMQHELQKHAARSPNSIMQPYEYAPGEVTQEVSRFFRLDEGTEWGEQWRWVDPIHEHVESEGPRISIGLMAIPVVHDKTEQDHLAAYARNREILEKMYDGAEMGTAARGRAAFHLAKDRAFAKELDTAADFYLEAARCLSDTSLAPSALIEISRIMASQGDLEAAFEFAGRAAVQYPMVAETLQQAACLNVARGAHQVAIDQFEAAAKVPPLPRVTSTDLWFSEGLVPSSYALALVTVGRVDDALAQLKKVPERWFFDPAVTTTFRTAQYHTLRRHGGKLLEQLVEFYLWDTEPMKALEFLDTQVPAALADQRIVEELREYVQSKIPQLEGWEAYKKVYGTIPRELYHSTGPGDAERDLLRQSPRGKRVIAWAAAQPVEGPPLMVLSVGFNDASIEEGMLRANPRVHLVLADVAVQANEALLDLQKNYPERVRGHDVQFGHYDWFSGEEAGSFDAILCFEVIEHVPSDHEMLDTFYAALKPTGVLFVSTPNADRWLETYLTKPEIKTHWHVRAHNPTSLTELFRSCEFDINLDAVGSEANLFVEARRGTLPFKDSIAIFAPGARPSFDADSVEDGFLGGSETAVAYLAEALGRLGYRVTVFTDRHTRVEQIEGRGSAGWRMCTRGNVEWREWNEFHPSTYDFGTVFYWRCPHLLPATAKHRRVLWTHDCAHPLGKKGYENADVVLALSESHAKSLLELDDYEGACRLVANGLNPESFPAFDVPRDPKKVLYVSSPDRGLERLLAWWPEVRARVPEATLDIYYSWAAARKKDPALIKRLEAKLEELKGLGVELKGGVSQPELHRAMRGAGIWAYPTSGKAETFCISLTSALASGCWPIVSDAGALQETADVYASLCIVHGCNDETIDTDAGKALFLKALTDVLVIPAEDSATLRLQMRSWALGAYSWDEVAKDFEELL